MEIIIVDRPIQDESTKPEEVQLINGVRYDWCVETERFSDNDGGIMKWLNGFKSDVYDGYMILIYNIRSVYIENVTDENDIYNYIRYTLIKK